MRLAVAALIILTASAAQAADYTLAQNARETTLPIRIVNNHIYGETLLNGQGPFTFIFDTAGSNVLTPETAKQLGLSVKGTAEAGFTKLERVEVGAAAVTDQSFTVLPLEALANVEGVQMPGMIGFELFRHFVTRIDYGAGTLTLIDPKTFDPKASGTAVKFTLNGHVALVQGTFEGLPVTYAIDTGARTEVTLAAAFAEKNDLRAKHPKGVDAVDGWGIGGASRAYVTRGVSVTLGSVRLDHVVTGLSLRNEHAFATDDHQGNIGGGLLKRFIVTFDYNHLTLYLKPLPPPVADIGTFDRAGLWLNKVGIGFQIADVTAKGPAQLAGLKIDDVISAVDGKPATEIALYDLRQRLRNDPQGAKVTFTIKRGEKTRDVVVRLRDQI